ncbi:MAG: hypothetical protein KAY32_11585 [Candidatus Eisenbacteria sp.]|nr:hypothetical protein [Candidatus Eisenbacteria bacterium]
MRIRAMTLALMRRDPALRPKIIAAALLASLALGGFIGLWVGVETYYHRSPVLDPASPGAILITSVVWVVLVGMLFAAPVNVRGPVFDLPLPLPARKIWSTRVLATIGIAMLVLAVTAGALAIAARLRGSALLEERTVQTLGLRIAAVIPLMVALIQN